MLQGKSSRGRHCYASPFVSHLLSHLHRSVLPENAYMGLDDVLRLGHLTLAIDQTSDRPESRTTLLDYMAPEMLSIQPHNEQELALLDVEGQGRGGTGSSHAGNIQQQQQQHQRNNWLQQPAQLEASRQASLDAAAAEEQHATYCSDTQAAGLQVQAAAARLSSSPMQHAGSSTLLGVGASAGRAAWEYQDHYTEKVDIWQLGCMVHELLCGSMPFEVSLHSTAGQNGVTRYCEGSFARARKLRVQVYGKLMCVFCFISQT